MSEEQNKEDAEMLDEYDFSQGVVGKKVDSRHAESVGSTDVVPTNVRVPPLETRV